MSIRLLPGKWLIWADSHTVDIFSVFLNMHNTTIMFPFNFAPKYFSLFFPSKINDFLSKIYWKIAAFQVITTLKLILANDLVNNHSAYYHFMLPFGQNGCMRTAQSPYGWRSHIPLFTLLSCFTYPLILS